jgi:hypothetical protein
MCTCTSCKFTDSFSIKGFDAWPKGEPKGPAKARAEYAAHWRHCGGSQKPHTLGSPFPCTGTPQTDPRIWYHFPNGQRGKARRKHGETPYSRDDYPHGVEGAAEYVAAFVSANNLT